MGATRLPVIAIPAEAEQPYKTFKGPHNASCHIFPMQRLGHKHEQIGRQQECGNAEKRDSERENDKFHGPIPLRVSNVPPTHTFRA